MKDFYMVIGLVITVAGGLFATVWLMREILNGLARVFPDLWIIVEYVYYRKEFKEYFKNKKSVTKKFNK